MSEFRFRMPATWKLSSHHISSIFVVGLDGIPWPCKIRIDQKSAQATEGPIVHVARNRDESGYVYFVYPLQQRGETLLCTGTLPARSAAYDLLKELARGTLSRLRNQLSIWEEGGLIIPVDLHGQVSQATHLMAATIMCEGREEQDRLAAETIECSIAAIFELSRVFGQQIAKYRQQHAELGKFWFANSLGVGDQYDNSLQHSAFDLLRVNGCWGRDSQPFPELINNPKRILIGSLLDASAGGMPDSLLEIEDYAARRRFLLCECRQHLQNVPENTALVHVISGLNGIGHRHLSYPQQLQLTSDLLSIADDVFMELPLMISFDFPWAERLAGAVGGIHPLQIADSLLRQGLRISYLGLEINLDYWPNGSVIRDPLQWIDMIDTWAQLDLPLVLCLRTPFGGKPADPGATIDRTANQQRSNVTEQQRLDFLDSVLPMMIARPIVRGIIWSQWQDGDDPRFPFGGLIDSAGNEKPIVKVIERLRKLM